MESVATSRRKGGVVLASSGIAVELCLTGILAGIAFFDSGSLDPAWVARDPWIVLIAAPGLLAAAGLLGPPRYVLAAGILCVPISFISLAGATLPLLVPAILYLIAYNRLKEA